MTLTNKFQEHITKSGLFSPTDKLLLAVSGGVDSVVLSSLCYQAGFNFAIAHCNFCLRGEESVRDEKFVTELAAKYGVQHFVQAFDTSRYAEENKLSIQVAARELRYAWFHELAVGSGFNYIVTAHHADDNIETLLMNFFKGTGILGLRGILSRQGKLIRPLLPFTKEELHAYANEQKLQYVEDASNSSAKYTRNYFRNQLIPDIEKVFPKVKNNLTDNIRRFQQIEMLYQQAIQLHKKKLLEIKGDEIQLSVLKLKKTEPMEAVIYEIIKDFGFSANQVGEVIKMLDSESGKYIASTRFQIIRNRKWLLIAPVAAEENKLQVVEEGTRQQEFQAGRLVFHLREAATHTISGNNNIADLNASMISYPLILRKCRQGDYFYPLGMKKKKKLNRFLSDQKLSVTEKEKVWVLEMNKKVIWVIGKRIDERFKIIPSTKQVMQVQFYPKG